MPDTPPERLEVSPEITPAPVPAASDKPAAPAPTERPAATPVTRPSQRNPVFAELVQGEEDLAGLVGYSLYKLNKRDWLASFFKAHGRDPTEEEVESYVLGERTQRRLATYRRLAEDMIGRKAAAVDRNGASVAAAAPQRISAMKGSSLRSSLVPDASPAPGSHRSPVATLMFWIAVLIVLGAAGYYYINYSSLFVGR